MQSHFLASIEEPQDPAVKQAYDQSSQLFSKVLTPVKVFNARMASHYSERQICEIVWLVASEHFYNVINIGLNIHSDMLCKVKSK